LTERQAMLEVLVHHLFDDRLSVSAICVLLGKLNRGKSTGEILDVTAVLALRELDEETRKVFFRELLPQMDSAAFSAAAEHQDVHHPGFATPPHLAALVPDITGARISEQTAQRCYLAYVPSGRPTCFRRATWGGETGKEQADALDEIRDWLQLNYARIKEDPSHADPLGLDPIHQPPHVAAAPKPEPKGGVRGRPGKFARKLARKDAATGAATRAATDIDAATEASTGAAAGAATGAASSASTGAATEAAATEAAAASSAAAAVSSAAGPEEATEKETAKLLRKLEREEKAAKKAAEQEEKIMKRKVEAEERAARKMVEAEERAEKRRKRAEQKKELAEAEQVLKLAEDSWQDY